ncbi:unnamed protein product [Ectocarpus fasciculatus]
MATRAPADIDEAEASPSIFQVLVQRERPLVLRNAARSWKGQPVLEKPGVKCLRTTWRIHPLGVSTVWEADCIFLEASVGQFLEWEGSAEPLSAEGDNPFSQYDRNAHWAYADYKHLKELEDDWAKALEPIIDWSTLGCEKAATDSTLWLGTGGSHTPLHFDTYGVNLVAQLHGRKRWLLYPPADTLALAPTRIPYEESSVFSQVDARAPDLVRFPQFADAHPLAVTLEPGDVLFVPKHWWHFVEATDTSLSVNVWVDAPNDSEDRAKESVARVLMTSLAGKLDAEVGPGWLNPTEEAAWPLDETLAVASLAFQRLNAHPEEESSDHENGAAGARAGGDFSVRAMADAITAPDVLQMVFERIAQKRRMG